jgi:2-methylcitrate dehydratase PrpD
LSAALAVAQAQPEASGRALLRAIVLGNDLTCRLGLAIQGSLYEYAWTRPPIIGIWGATAAACAVMDLSEDEIRSAFGFTLHQTANTLECLYAAGSEVRGLRDGFSARNGVTAASMAKAGIRGDRSSLEGRFGLFNAYFRGEYDRERLLHKLGTHFESDRVSIKPWPSARETHAAIQTILELRERHQVSPEQVRSIRLFVGKTNLEFCEPAQRRQRPAARMDALSSLPYAVAVAMQHGSVPLQAYTAQGLRDERVLAMAKRVSWEVDESRSADGTIEGATAELELTDGARHRHTVRHGLGHPDTPLPDDIVLRKFVGCASMAHRPVDEAQARRLWDLVARLETLSVAEFATAIPR